MPYWDWTVPNAAIPALAGDLTYTDPYTKESVHNPFHDADVAFLNEKTSRQVYLYVHQSSLRSCFMLQFQSEKLVA